MPVTLTAEVESALAILKDGLKDIYGPRLKSSSCTVPKLVALPVRTPTSMSP